MLCAALVQRSNKGGSVGKLNIRRVDDSPEIKAQMALIQELKESLRTGSFMPPMRVVAMASVEEVALKAARGETLSAPRADDHGLVRQEEEFRRRNLIMQGISAAENRLLTLKSKELRSRQDEIAPILSDAAQEIAEALLTLARANAKEQALIDELVAAGYPRGFVRSFAYEDCRVPRDRNDGPKILQHLAEIDRAFGSSYVDRLKSEVRK